MLVLTRKRNEVIDIGGEIRITVVEIRGDKVRIGIDAPRHISVNRSEISDKIRSLAVESAASGQTS